MKKLLSFFSLIVLFATAQASVPQRFSYQAVIRNSEGNLLIDTPINLRISILVGSENGSNVYQETHSARTNTNGLVSLSIGEGTTTGNFSTIDWSQGAHYLKLEIDPLNNGTYSITGTSQLLSVPYALHAKTSESIESGAGEESGSGSSKYRVGQLYGGGVVFWIDTTGEHGLILTLTDLSQGQTWSNVPNAEIGTEAASRIDGNRNSAAITNQGGHTDSAAKICLNYTNPDKGTGTFSDWYLPSFEEMKKVWQNQYELEATREKQSDPDLMTPLNFDMYWTSTEYNQYSAWGFNFYNGNPYTSNKFTVGHVRAVRKF